MEEAPVEESLGMEGSNSVFRTFTPGGPSWAVDVITEVVFEAKTALSSAIHCAKSPLLCGG